MEILPRGYHITEDDRITKIITSGTDWWIYLTNRNLSVLVTTPVLYHRWCDEYALSEELLKYIGEYDCYILVGKANYLISSLDAGPYPDTYMQIEAFSDAFRKNTEEYPGTNWENAIYIEQYSLLLPTEFVPSCTALGNVYGKWITGGVNISIESIDRISRLMSWTTPASLEKAAITAGFAVALSRCEGAIENDSTVAISIEEAQPTPSMNPSSLEFRLIGRPELEKFLKENIIDIVLNQEQYKRMGISFPGATILYGPPGCGKTYAIEKLSEYLGWKRFDIDSNSIASSYIHDTSKKIAEVFNEAIKAAPSIIVIDEMEAFLSDRSAAGVSGTHHIEEVAEFLRRIPEATSKGVLIFAMTNMLNSIDPAILRRGRFDHIIEVEMAKTEEIAAVLQNKTSELPLSDDVNLLTIASALDSHPLSDVAFVLREAGKNAVKRQLDAINSDCFTDALAMLPKKKEKNKIGF